ncbi:amidase [Pseudonocardia ailaonensis]|uniref:Amidase n=1 Tax=Pseudonocardia ailaonensis TaxID=367279 RepID=A0ABN2NI37_9PSEU
MDAGAIAAEVQAGRSAVDVVEEALARIRELDPGIRAFREVSTVAREDAAAVDENPDRASLPLAGVPVAVKENVGPDHEIVRRWRGAGAVVVGTTRMPELAIWPMTDDPTGITRNPQDPRVTAGGSSGGAGAAVATGMVALAHGTDGLGSIRIPSAVCGVVGIKPGRGLLPTDMPAGSWLGLSEHGVLARSAADVALGLDVLAGRSPTPLEEPTGLRISVDLRNPVRGMAVSAADRQAVATAAAVLAGAGHTVVEGGPAQPASLGPHGSMLWTVAVNAEVEELGLDRAALQPRSRRHAALGRRLARFAGPGPRAAWRARCEAWFAEGRDVLLTPTLAADPPPAEDWHLRPWRSNILAALRYAPFAAPWNLAALPALSVPVGHRPTGLRGAVQLIGPPGSERRLLALAAQLPL